MCWQFPPRCVEHLTSVTIFKTTPKKYWCRKLFSESWGRTDTRRHKTIELNEKIHLTTARTNCSWTTQVEKTLNITLLVWMYRCCRRRVLTSSQTLRINMSNFSKMSTFGKNSTYVYNNNNIQLEMSFIWFPLWCRCVCFSRGQMKQRSFVRLLLLNISRNQGSLFVVKD